MKNKVKLTALAAFLMLGAFTFTAMRPNIAAAHQDEIAQADTDAQSEQSQDAAYSYSAQPGDSYTKIARKAVQTFGIKKQVTLSQAQIVAAETYLTLEAGSPVLNTGQEVKVSESAVDAAIKKAQGLNEAQLKLWDKYVRYVNFNTDNVGEKRS